MLAIVSSGERRDALLRISPAVMKASEAAKAPQFQMVGEPGYFVNTSTSNALASRNNVPVRPAHVTHHHKHSGASGASSAVRVGPSSGAANDQLQELLRQHARLMQAASDVDSALKDIRKYGEEGAKNAGIAAGWAATLMTLDIIRHATACVYRSAERQFAFQDKVVEEANKTLKRLGQRTIPTRGDVLSHLEDPTAQKVAEYARDVRVARETIKRLLKDKPPREVEMLVNMGLDMAEDSAMVLEAQSLQQRALSNSANAQAQALLQRERLRQHMQRIEERMALLINPDLWEKWLAKQRTG
jgi:hypothetical protein